MKSALDTSATLDDIAASINATVALKNAQNAANQAQLTEAASIKATIDSISKAIEATQASKTLAASQLDVTLAARDDAAKLVSLQVAAAIEELNSVKAEISSFSEKTTAFEAKSASALKSGETRIDDIKSAILAADDAQSSGITTEWRLSSYVGFIVSLALASIIGFQSPVATLLILRLGIFGRTQIKGYRKQ